MNIVYVKIINYDKEFNRNIIQYNKLIVNIYLLSWYYL